MTHSEAVRRLREAAGKMAAALHTVGDRTAWLAGRSEFLRPQIEEAVTAYDAVLRDLDALPPEPAQTVDPVAWLRERACTPSCITPRGIHSDCVTLRNAADALAARMRGNS